MFAASQFALLASEKLLGRNAIYEEFFNSESEPLALACRSMARRFLDGGRLLALGRGAYATDAQHVSVEFVHPVIVGKRALPALDISMIVGAPLETNARSRDIVMGFGPPGGDPGVNRTLDSARAIGAMTFALPGRAGEYSVACFSPDPFQHQEMIEILYHTLWETVHVFFERRPLESETGDAGFLYPFLGATPQDDSELVHEVAASIRMKVADDARLRSRVAREQAEAIAQAAGAIAQAVRRGGKLILFGNGGSATDANDWALDCALPPPGLKPVPAISLSSEPAVLTAIANDVGVDVVFLRQAIAHADPGDVAVAISTSGGSRNLMSALLEARRRNLTTVALLGYDGGEILRSGLADYPIVVHCDYIPRIQEVQASIYHTIRELIDLADA
jgi:D-sedoheptulose 7-phosphate isomerase